MVRVPLTASQPSSSTWGPPLPHTYPLVLPLLSLLINVPRPPSSQQAPLPPQDIPPPPASPLAPSSEPPVAVFQPTKRTLSPTLPRTQFAFPYAPDWLCLLGLSDGEGQPSWCGPTAIRLDLRLCKEHRETASEAWWACVRHEHSFLDLMQSILFKYSQIKGSKHWTGCAGPSPCRYKQLCNTNTHTYTHIALLAMFEVWSLSDRPCSKLCEQAGTHNIRLTYGGQHA